MNLLELKPLAHVLDATAGNRTIYTRGMKETPYIIYIDIEAELEVPPDALVDCRRTGFPDAYFHTIIFDPPHSFGHEKNRSYFTSPNSRDVKPEWGHHQVPAYYGADKYPTMEALRVFVAAAFVEFRRILSPGGMVIFKWGECHKSADQILTWAREVGFVELMRTSRRYREGSRGGVWVMLVKKELEASP